VLLVHAQDLVQQKKLIPDIPTWVQCFSHYAAIVCSKYSDHRADLLGYISQIMRVINALSGPLGSYMTKAFVRKRQNGALRNGLRWTPAYLFNVLQGKQKTWRLGAKFASPSIIAWTSALLTPPPINRPRPSTYSATPQETCKRYNKFNGNCSFGTRCTYAHKCLKCGGEHPISACPKKPVSSHSSED